MEVYQLRSNTCTSVCVPITTQGQQSKIRRLKTKSQLIFAQFTLDFHRPDKPGDKHLS